MGLDMGALEQAWQFLKADVTLPGSETVNFGHRQIPSHYARQHAKAKLGIRNDAPVVFPPSSSEVDDDSYAPHDNQFYINDLSRSLADNDFRNALIDVGAYGPEQRRPDTMHPSNRSTHYMYPHFGDIYGKDRKDGGFRQGLGIALDPRYSPGNGNNFGTLSQSKVYPSEEARLRELL